MSTTEYRANLRDMHFHFYEVLKIGDLIQKDKYAHLSSDEINMTLSEGAKLAEKALGPAARIMDREPVRYEKGKVIVHPLVKELYPKIVEMGWITAATVAQAYGGQGLPECVFMALNEFFNGSNMGLMTYMLLTRGSAHLIESFGSEEQKRMYMAPMYAGRFSGTMCITEPSAGSAVPDLKATARRAGDHYLIKAQKIFITAGEHDVTENIIHLLLAKVEGQKDVSLFIVPKIHLRNDGTLGEPNDIACGGVEHKMGLKGSATCMMNFGDNGDCRGYLIGQEGGGLRCMFQLMNEARLGMGSQSVGIASAAYLNALAYAKERIQGVHISTWRQPDAPRVPIIKHPDVRRMLIAMKAYVEGMRAFVLSSSYLLDRFCTTSGEEQEKARAYLELITPICKAYTADMCFRVTETAIQVFGGYGYCSEYPVEQYLRDVKIASIYEGTTGIQAMDLVGRKIGMKRGQVFTQYLGELQDFLSGLKGHPRLAEAAAKISAAKDRLAEATITLGGMAMQGDLEYPLFQSAPYLYAFGDILISFELLRQATVADEKLALLGEKTGARDRQALYALAETNPDVAFYLGKLEAAEYFIYHELPNVYSRLDSLSSGHRSGLKLPEAAF